MTDDMSDKTSMRARQRRTLPSLVSQFGRNDPRVRYDDLLMQKISDAMPAMGDGVAQRYDEEQSGAGFFGTPNLEDLVYRYGQVPRCPTKKVCFSGMRSGWGRERYSTLHQST